MRTLVTIQGIYFLLTGIWPILHMRSFEIVTGPKVDDWLVKTVGALVGVVGAVLLYAAQKETISFELILVAIGSALVLTIIDVVYVLKGRIARIYLADAVAEVILIACWLVLVPFRELATS